MKKKTQKSKMLQNSKTQIVTKLKITGCHKNCKKLTKQKGKKHSYFDKSKKKSNCENLNWSKT